MALTQENMVAGPDAVIVGTRLPRRTVPVIMIVVMTMRMAVRMPMSMIVCVQGMVVRHDRSLAGYRCKVA